MAVFLILAGFCVLILYRQIGAAFMANPGLNGLIIGVLVLGVLLALRQVIRLFREIEWANAFRCATPAGRRRRSCWRRWRSIRRRAPSGDVDR